MWQITSFITLTTALLASASPILQRRGCRLISPTFPDDVIPNQYIVTFKSDANNLAPRNVSSLVDDIVAELSGSLSRRAGEATPQVLSKYDFGEGSFQGFAVDLPPSSLAQLKDHPDVLDLQPNIMHQSPTVEMGPVEPYGGLSTRALPRGLWGLDAIDGRVDGQFTSPARGGENVDVYVIDTGVDARHSEFEGRALIGPAFIGPKGPGGHGTHVAGTIAGRTFGIARRATIISVQVFPPTGSGAPSNVIIAGINWAAQSARKRGRAAVANLSLGSGRDQSIERAVQGLINAGVATAVAAGNEHRNACTVSPAALPDAITVAASSVNFGFTTRFSNSGACVDITAPGDGILSSFPGNRQTIMSGTSMATPHVTGALAVERSLRPTNDVQAIRNRLIETSQRALIRNLPPLTPNLFLRVPQ
ncbi:peptidase S8/S53 domain-containing protein [Phlyctochytrium arcticum]|nr:peptidase S8/S53 domain-containing protein [Phlyctochytrium arcticum]